MDRKNFLSLVCTAGAGAAISLPGKTSNIPDESLPLKIPPYLKRGDIIGITCPAGYITYDDILPAIRIMKDWGFEVRIGKTVGDRYYTFGGTDEHRLDDFQTLLDDPEVKAIMCARGGYGIARIIDDIDFSKFRKRPKWLIGFSDITVLHCHLDRNLQVASLHSKMCNSFPEDFTGASQEVQATILSIKEALTGQRMVYNAAYNEQNRPGKGRGKLIGGNLSMLQSIAATRSDIHTKGKILFLEDTGEYLYSLDRMMGNLQRSGKLDQLAGLLIGGFTKIKPDDPGEEFGKSIYEIVMEKIAGINFPVCFDFPVGHIKNNYALKCGIIHELNVAENGDSSLVEIR